MRRRLIGGLVVLATLTLAGRGSAQVGADLEAAPHANRFSPRIVNGVLTSQYPTVGVLLDSNNFNSAGMVCSGTLVGCNTFLTAGHCVAGSLNPASRGVFLQHAGFFEIASITMRSDFDFPIGDVAVIKLQTPVTGIAPTAVDSSGAAFGTSGLIVGFGRTGGSNGDYGLKRSGSVITSPCSGGVSDTTSICFDFNYPFGAPGSNSDTCNGDSGGPLFINYGAGNVVSGVTSGGSSSNCLPTDNSYDANVFHYHSWIADQGGPDMNNTSCGNMPQVGQPGTNIFAASGQLNGAKPQAVHSFNVPFGTTQLRVAMNAIDDGSDFDLYVRRGSAPTTTDYDCKADGTGQYGFCQFNTPVPGPWFVLINDYSGQGVYQVTGSTFGIDCSNPSNDGSPCDDNNTCTQNDHCQSGTCSGAAVNDGTPCDDGNICTQPDTCSAGTCTSTSNPRTDCQGPFAAQKGRLRLQDRDLNQQDKLSWTWPRGTATSKEAFGDPLNSTDYTLCLYDQTAGVNSVVLAEHIPPGRTCGKLPCWKKLGKGFSYTDRSSSKGQITRLRLTAGGDGSAKISVKGENLQSLAPLPLHQQSTVTLQLSNGPKCWEARFDTHVTNTAADFVAKPN